MLVRLSVNRHDNTVDTDGKRDGRLAVVLIDRYDHLPGLDHSRREVAETAVLLETLGFATQDPPAGQGLLADLLDMLRGFEPAERRLLLYWTGHGKGEHDGRHYLAARDSPSSGLDSVNAIPMETLGRRLARTDAEQILVLVDACYSGGGADELATAFKAAADARRSVSGRPRGIAVITSAERYDTAREKVFAAAIRTLLTDGPPAGPELNLWGPHDKYIGADEFARALSMVMGDGSALQRPDIATRGPLGRWLHNPHHEPDLPSRPLLDPGSEVLRAADVAEHFLPKFRGIEVGERGWYFTGREQQLRELVDWLGTAPHGLAVVTGAPGTGKSALLGRIALLSVPRYREAAEAAGGATGVVPPVGAIDIGLHAKNKTLLECAAEIAAAAGLPASGWATAEQFVAAVGRSGRRLTILVDALDETQPDDTYAIAADLLRPLAHLDGVRVLVGTRPDRAGLEAGADGPLLRSLAAEHTVRLADTVDTRKDVAAYARLRLRATPGSPYADRPEAAEAAAEEIGRAAQGVFLIARLLARALAGRADVLDLTGTEARELFSGGLADVFAADLRRYGSDMQRVVVFLRALAWAEGAGLPRRQVWLAVADALGPAGSAYTEDDLNWIMAHAGAHLIEAGEDGQTVYRLYHQSYNDYFRRGRDPARVQSLVVDGLLATVRQDGVPAWPIANPYVLRHLATHAAAAGRIEEVIRDAGLLVYADPDRLARALATLGSVANPAAELYWRALDTLRTTEPDHRAKLLHNVALHEQPTGLAVLGGLLAGEFRALWSTTPTGPLLLSLTGHTDAVLSVSFGTVGGRTLLATASLDRTVRIWDAATSEQLLTIGGFAETPRTAAFVATGAGPCVAVLEEGGRVRLWDPVSGAALEAQVPGMTGFDELAVHGQLLAGSRGETIELWDVAAASLRMTLDRVPGGPTDLRRPASTFGFGEHRDGVYLVDGGGGRVRVWDTGSGAVLTDRLEHDDGWVRKAAGGVVGGRAVIAGSGNGTALWDLASGREVLRLRGHLSCVALGTSRQHGPVLAGGQAVWSWASNRDHNQLVLWDARTGEERLRLRSRGPARTVAFGTVSDRSLLASVSDESSAVSLWDLSLGADDRPAATAVTALALRSTEAGPLLAASTDDGVRMWNARTGEHLFRLAGEPYPGRPLAFGRLRERTLLATGESDSVYLWDAHTGAELASLAEPAPWTSALEFGRLGDRRVLASGSADGHVRLWDVATRRVRLALRLGRRAVPAHRGAVTAVAFGRIGDDTVLVSCAADAVHLWDAHTGEHLADLGPGFADATGVATVDAAGAAILVAGFRDGRVWIGPVDPRRAGEGRTVQSREPGRAVTAVAAGVHEPWPLAATGNLDGEVVLYDATNGQWYARVVGHFDEVAALTVGSDGGRTLLAVADQARATVYELPDATVT